MDCRLPVEPPALNRLANIAEPETFSFEELELASALVTLARDRAATAFLTILEEEDDVDIFRLG